MQRSSRSKLTPPSLFKICLGRSHRAPVITVVIIGLFLSILLIGFLAFGEETTDNTHLVFISILFRHGQRTPTEFYKDDPYADPKYWPDGIGQLTKAGKLEMYDLGRTIRGLYGSGNWLNTTYRFEDIRMQSSAHDRCLMSAELVLAGLYPPVGEQRWNPDLAWQPIPVHSTPFNYDKLITMRHPCPKYKQELAKAYKSDDMNQFNARYQRLYEDLTKFTGEPMNNITVVEFLYNTLEIEIFNGLELPKWTENFYPKPMIELTKKSYGIFTETDKLKRLRGGPLLGEIVTNMLMKRNHSLPYGRRMMLYSVHDITIISLLRTMGFGDQFLKLDFGATLLMELYNTNHGLDMEVKIKFLSKGARSEGLSAQTLRIPHCPPPCMLQDFVNVTKQFIPENWDKECQL